MEDLEPEPDMNERARNITRRTALGLFAAAGAGYVAFGAGRDRVRHDGKRLILDYWEKWTGHEADAMKKVVEAFNQSQDGILVNYLTMAGIDQKAKISIAAGDPPPTQSPPESSASVRQDKSMSISKYWPF